jgi:hypothetical protein
MGKWHLLLLDGFDNVQDWPDISNNFKQKQVARLPFSQPKPTSPTYFIYINDYHRFGQDQSRYDDQ